MYNKPAQETTTPAPNSHCVARPNDWVYQRLKPS